jgi:hypothetical protein
MDRLPRLLQATVLLLLSLPLSAADKGTSSLAKKADPSGTGPLMGQLRALFATWDVNKDGYLDKAELARGFRGEDAKPYEPPVHKVPNPPAEEAGAKNDKAAPIREARNIKEFTHFPDYQFLLTVDQNGDGKVSRDEFINWAREYAVQQKNITAAEKSVAKLQVKLVGRSSLSTRLQAEADLKMERDGLAKLVGQLPPFEKALQQALNPQLGKKVKK